MLVLVLGGCDYVLGLDERVDASGSPVDDTLPMKDASRLCFEDSFPGTELDISTWSYVGTNNRIVVSTNADLVFRFLTPSALGEAGIRTQATFGIKDRAVTAQLQMPPQMENFTALRLVRSNVTIYELRLTSDDQVHMYVGLTQRAQVARGGRGYLRIRSDGQDVIFGASLDGNDFSEMRFDASGLGFDNLQIEMAGGVTGTIATMHDVTFDRVTATCPP